VTDFLSGGTMVASLAIGLFFFRYWRETRDRLFGIFALAFWTFAVNRLLLLFLEDDDEAWVFLSRAVAFALIIVAIVDKNRGGGAQAGTAESSAERSERT
jgi:hypothetical protein